MRSNARLTALKSCALIALAAGLGTSAAAQTTTPVYREVSHISLQPGRQGDFRAAVKEYNELLRKAGWDKRSNIWQSATGPSEFRMVTAHNKLAELDTPIRMDPRMKDYLPQLQAINARIVACIAHSTRVIDRIEADLSLPLAKEPPTLLRVRHAVVRNDKTEEFLALIKNELMPYVKQSGVTTFSYSRVRFGGSTNEFYSVSGAKSWADLDEPPPFIKAMGDAKYQAYLKQSAAMITRSDVNVYRYQADLSYMPPVSSASK